MKIRYLCITACLIGIVLSGCCSVSNETLNHTVHAINGSAEVAKGELVLCKKHDAKACDNVGNKLDSIITKSNELDTLTK